jgi:hypothetical protein
MLSPKPGHMKRPLPSTRNQFTQKIRGLSVSARPRRSQWLK